MFKGAMCRIQKHLLLVTPVNCSNLLLVLALLHTLHTRDLMLFSIQFFFCSLIRNKMILIIHLQHNIVN